MLLIDLGASEQRGCAQRVRTGPLVHVAARKIRDKVQRQIEKTPATFNSIPQQSKPKVVSLKHSLSVGSRGLQAPCSTMAFWSDTLNSSRH